MNWTRTRPRKNKANFRRDSYGEGAAWLPMVLVRLSLPNKANLAERAAEGRSYNKQSQFRAGAKPGADYAKPTQFRKQF